MQNAQGKFVRATRKAKMDRNGVAHLADIQRCCYDPRSGARCGRLIPALGDRLMVGLQTLTLPV